MSQKTMDRQHFDKTVRIPIITDLVVAGNPEFKRKLNTGMDGVESDKQAYDLRLKQKISELKDTIGQEGDNIARAHAIRAEATNGKLDKISDTHHEKNIDRDRAKLIKKLEQSSNQDKK